jgi:hypothetical protein
MVENIHLVPKKGDGGLDNRINFDLVNEEEFHEKMDSYDFVSKAQAARYFINIGMKSIVENDPRNVENNRPSRSGQDNYSPETIRDFIPEGKDNAVDIRDELLDRIEDEILNICREDPAINIDNWEAYR